MQLLLIIVEARGSYPAVAAIVSRGFAPVALLSKKTKKTKNPVIIPSCFFVSETKFNHQSGARSITRPNAMISPYTNLSKSSSLKYTDPAKRSSFVRVVGRFLLKGQRLRTQMLRSRYRRSGVLNLVVIEMRSSLFS